jgi:hypothetical protein
MHRLELPRFEKKPMNTHAQTQYMLAEGQSVQQKKLTEQILIHVGNVSHNYSTKGK